MVLYGKPALRCGFFSLENRGTSKKDMDYSAELCYNENDFGPFLRAVKYTAGERICKHHS